MLQIFTGVGIGKTISRKKLLRPLIGEELGFSDELLELTLSSLAHEAKERPSVSTFVNLLERATPNIAMLGQLVGFDANSEGHIQELRRMFEYKDNTLLGMREEETFVVIEVFDMVKSSLNGSPHLSNVSHFVCFQALNSLLNDPTLRGRCLRGLQQVSARCSLLPKSHWIPYNSIIEPDGASSAPGRVSSNSQCLADGRLVAVKLVSPPHFEDFDTIKRASPPLKHPGLCRFMIGLL